MSFSAITAVQLLFRSAHGLANPPIDGCVTHALEPCAMCGGMSSNGMSQSDFIGPSLTDQSLFRSPTSLHVCSACVYVRGSHSPVPGRPPKDGKAFGGRFANYSHFIDESRYENASKGEKPKIVQWLSSNKSGHWGCVIADSGQKHLLPYAPLNPPGARGLIRFEEQVIQLPKDMSLIGLVAQMLTLGATKEEIESANYSARAWELCGQSLLDFERDNARLRGSAWFSLALWLAQRDEAIVSERIKRDADDRVKKRGAKDANRRNALGIQTRVSSDNRCEGTGALANSTRQDAGGCAKHEKCGRVGHRCRSKASDSANGQRDLFSTFGSFELRPGEPGLANDENSNRSRERSTRGAGTKVRRGSKGEARK